MVATKRRLGRPPRGRDRHVYMAPLETPLFELLEQVAAASGYTFSAVASIIVSDAYGAHSPWDPDLDYSTLDVDIDRARALAATPPVPFSGVGGSTHTVALRLDRELADHVNARCDEQAVAYGHEIRRIITAAFGMDRPELLRFVHRHGKQDALPIPEAS